MRDDERTPARTPSSIQRLTHWGVLEAWLTQGFSRAIVIAVGPRGLCVTVIDPDRGERIEDVGLDEDLSKAAMRAWKKLHE